MSWLKRMFGGATPVKSSESVETSVQGEYPEQTESSEPLATHETTPEVPAKESLQAEAGAFARAAEMLSKGDKAGAKQLCEEVLSASASAQIRCDILQIRAMTTFMEQNLFQYFKAADDFLAAACISDAELSVRASCLKNHQSILEWTVSEAKKITSNPTTPPATKAVGELIVASAWARQGQCFASGLTAVHVFRSPAATQATKEIAQALVGTLVGRLTAVAETTSLPAGTRLEAIFNRGLLRELSGDASGSAADFQLLAADPHVSASIKDAIERLKKGDQKLTADLITQETSRVKSSLSLKNGKLDLRVFDHAAAAKQPTVASDDSQVLDTFLVWHTAADLAFPSVAIFAPRPAAQTA